VVQFHRAELGEEQKIENMRNGEKANPGHTGNGMRGTGGTVAVIGDTNGDITKGGEAERGKKRPIGEHIHAGVAPGQNRDNYKKDTIDCLKQGVVVEQAGGVGHGKQGSQPDNVEPGKDEKCRHSGKLL